MIVRFYSSNLNYIGNLKTTIFFILLLMTIDKSFAQYPNLCYNGNKRDKDKAIRQVEKSLHKNVDFGAYGSLKEGLVKISQLNKIEITDLGSGYHVIIYPVNNDHGHE